MKLFTLSSTIYLHSFQVHTFAYPKNPSPSPTTPTQCIDLNKTKKTYYAAPNQTSWGKLTYFLWICWKFEVLPIQQYRAWCAFFHLIDNVLKNIYEEKSPVHKEIISLKKMDYGYISQSTSHILMGWIVGTIFKKIHHLHPLPPPPHTHI